MTERGQQLLRAPQRQRRVRLVLPFLVQCTTTAEVLIKWRYYSGLSGKLESVAC